jgi:putative transposase
MKNIYQAVLLVIVGATQRELARQVRYLKVENEILRSRLPKRVIVVPKERARLVKFARKLTAQMLRPLVTIVHPDTLLGWVRDGRTSSRAKPTGTPRGRPRTELALRRLILKLARENSWGYTRILGELKKLGITPPSRNTVKNILRTAGLDPGPKRGESTWDDFLKRHAASLWQCDFFSRRVITKKGIRQVFVLAFLNVKTRRVILSPATYKPDAIWIAAQAESFVKQARDQGLPVARLIHDRDKKLSSLFDNTLRRHRVKVVKTPFRSPNMNAFVERFVQSITQECLNHFIVFGTPHMDVLCREYLTYYHRHRPHQGKRNELLLPPKRRKRRCKATEDIPALAELRCESRLGGLLKSYHRKAA